MENIRRLVITNDEYSHLMVIDPFSFREHHSLDPDRVQALDQAIILRHSSLTYGKANRTLQVRGLRLSKNGCYNLVKSEGKHSPEEELHYTLGTLKMEGFHVRYLKK